MAGEWPRKLVAVPRQISGRELITKCKPNAWPKSGQTGGHVYAVARLLPSLNHLFMGITIIEGYRVLPSKA